MTKLTKVGLRTGEKALRDNVSIRFNELSERALSGPSKEETPKSMLVKFAIRTEYHGLTGNARARSGDCGEGYKTFSKVSRLRDNPRQVIQAWMAVFNELLPGKPEPDPIMALELFMAFLTGTAAKEYEEILFKESWELFNEEIEVRHNSRLSTYKEEDQNNAKRSDEALDVDEDLTEAARKRAKILRKWIARNEARKSARADTKLAGVKSYDYKFPPGKIPPPPSRPSKGRFFAWADSGLNAVSPLAWIRLHNHGWEYYQAFQEKVFLAVQGLAFHTAGKKAGTIQLEYLTEDLVLENSLQLQKFLTLVDAHSMTQPYFPPISNNSEVGKVFSDERKIRILWNAAHEKFKTELTNLHVVRFDDLRTWENAIEKFRLAEERWLEKQALLKEHEEKNKRNSRGPGNDRSRANDRNASTCSRNRSNSSGSSINGRDRGGGSNGNRAHRAAGRGGSRGASHNSGSKRQRLSYEEWQKRKTQKARKEQAEYEAYCNDFENAESGEEPEF